QGCERPMEYFRSDERLHRDPPLGARRPRYRAAASAVFLRELDADPPPRDRRARRGRADAGALQRRDEPSERRARARRIPRAALARGDKARALAILRRRLQRGVALPRLRDSARALRLRVRRLSVDRELP